MPLTRLVGAGLGFVASYQEHRKEVNASRKEHEATSRDKRPEDDEQSDSSSASISDVDEEEWGLDDVADADDDDKPPAYDDVVDGENPTEALVRATMYSEKKSPAYSRKAASIPLPVILPQRRPGNRRRGFVRAYAPVLQDVGIDEATFLRFLKNFHASSQASPWFTVIQVGAGIAGFAPGVIAMAVTMAVQTAARVGEGLQERYRTNDFLARINDELFRPAGLFAMIITYKPDVPPGQMRRGLINTAASAAGTMISSSFQSSTKSQQQQPSAMVSFGQKFKSSAGVTTGEAQLPESAPLIFPAVDAAVIRAANNGPETFSDKRKDFNKFVAGYMDRRAQMRFDQDNPSSSLSTHNIQGSRSAAPYYAASPSSSTSPSPYPDNTLGQIAQAMQSRNRGDRHSRRRDRRDMLYPRNDNYPPTTSSSSYYNTTNRDRSPISYADNYPASSRSAQPPPPSSSRRSRRGGGVGGLAGRLMKQDVLYLKVLNLPSDAELRHAQTEFEMQQQQS